MQSSLSIFGPKLRDDCAPHQNSIQIILTSTVNFWPQTACSLWAQPFVVKNMKVGRIVTLVCIPTRDMTKTDFLVTWLGETDRRGKPHRWHTNSSSFLDSPHPDDDHISLWAYFGGQITHLYYYHNNNPDTYYIYTYHFFGRAIKYSIAKKEFICLKIC